MKVANSFVFAFWAGIDAIYQELEAKQLAKQPKQLLTTTAAATAGC